MEEVYEEHGVSVRYKFREAKQDRQHLVVVFAGVDAGKHDFYGFDGGTLDHLKGAVLWIKDSFDGHNAYYLGAALDYKIALAVGGLIDSTLASLRLTASQCTLLGASKGGAAALHLGLRFGYGNVIAAVPQTRLGSYTRLYYPDIFSYIASTDLDASEVALNDYIPDLIRAPASLATNIYLVSSYADPEYATQIEPYLDKFARFENFNLLLTDSTLVTGHTEVTAYNIPFILGTLYALCEGLAPRYGHVFNGNGEVDREVSEGYFARKRAIPQVVGGWQWLQLRGDALTFRAYAAELGEMRAVAPTAQPLLVADDGVSSHSFAIDAVPDRSLNAKLYNKYFCDYTWAGLQPTGAEGLLLRDLPPGKFELRASFDGESGRREVALKSKNHRRLSGIHAGHVYSVDSGRDITSVTKTPLDGRVAEGGFFCFDQLEIESDILRLRGAFIVPNEEMRAWDAGIYALTLTNGVSTVSFLLGTSPARKVPGRPQHLQSDGYGWANFATLGGRGIDLGAVSDGDYACYVSLVRDERVYTGDVRFGISATGGSFRLQRTYPHLR